MVDVTFFEGPDTFAEFGSVPMFHVSEICGVVSVSSLEVVFCESDEVLLSLRVTVAWEITDVH